MILGIEREHSWRADHDVIDVGVIRTYWNAMDDTPTRPKFVKLPGNLLFTGGATPPGTFLGMHSKNPPKKNADWKRFFDF